MQSPRYGLWNETFQDPNMATSFFQYKSLSRTLLFPLICPLYILYEYPKISTTFRVYILFVDAIIYTEFSGASPCQGFQYLNRFFDLILFDDPTISPKVSVM